MKYTNLTTCPKCSYIRKETDSAPLSECPNCGIYYEKYEAMMAARTTGNTAQTNEPSDYISTVPTTCPKCSYIRKVTDNAPLWKCPQCDIVYEKYEAMMAARNRSDTATTNQPSDYISTVPTTLSPNPGIQSSRTKKKTIGMAIGLCLLVLMLFFGYREYRVHQLRQQLNPVLTPFINEAVLLASSVIVVHALLLGQPDSGAKYQGLIDDIDKRLLSVQKLSTNSNARITGPVVQYIQLWSTYVKFTKLAMDSYANHIKAKTALDQISDAQKDMQYPGLRLMALDVQTKLLKTTRKSLEQFLGLTEDQIRTLEAINDLGHDLAKEFESEALFGEQMVKHGLKFHKEILHVGNEFLRKHPDPDAK